MIFRATVTFLGVLLVSHAQAQTAKKPVPVKPRLDALGDPLPDGAVARLGTLRFKHMPAGDPTIDIALFSPDGSKIVSLVYGQGSIRLWDTASGKEIPGPWTSAGRYTAVAFSPDGRQLIAGGQGSFGKLKKNGEKEKGKVAGPQNAVIFYDMAGARPLRTVPVQGKLIRALSLADQGKTLITAGGGSVDWWDAGSGKHLRTWKIFDEKQPLEKGGTKTKTFNDCAIAPDGKAIAVHVVWQMDNGKGPPRFQPTPMSQEAVGFTLATKKMNWRSLSKKTRQQQGRGRFAYSADGKRLAIAVATDKVEVRDPVTGKLIVSPLASGFPVGTFLGGLALSADGTMAALAGPDSNVVIWNLKDRMPPRKFVARIAQFWPASTQCLHFSADGKKLLVGADADLQVYDVATLQEIRPAPGHRGWIDYLAFAADGKRLWSGCADMNLYSQELAAWDTASWQRMQLTSLKAPPWPNVGVVAPNQSVYAGKSGPDLFGLYDLKSGKLHARLAVPKGQTPPGQPTKRGIAAQGFFSPAGKYYLVRGQDPEGKDAEGLYAVPSGKLLCWLPALVMTQQTMESCRPIAFSVDERLVALFAASDRMIHVIDTATGKERCRLPGAVNADVQKGPALIANLSFTRDSKLLASWYTGDTGIRVSELATGKELLQVVPDVGEAKGNVQGGPQQRRIHFSWSPDNRVLAVGEKQVDLVELATLGVRRKLPGHAGGPIRGVAFSPDGRVLATGSSDTTVLIWDMSDGPRTYATLPPPELARRWQSLSDHDAARGYAAIRDLAAAPADSVPWIRDHLKPVRAVDGKRIMGLIDLLNHDQYPVRQKANGELLAIGEQIVPALDKVLTGGPSLEARLRLQKLRKGLTGMLLVGERLQAARAVEALERIGTPEAHQILATLAGGAKGALVTRQAHEALARLDAGH